MLSSAQHLTPKPAPLPPATPPVLPGGGSAGGPSFAQFLNDQPDLLPPPAHADPVPQAPDEAREATAAPAPSASAAPARRKEGHAAQAKPTTPAQGVAAEATEAGKAAKATQASEDSTEPSDAAADIDPDAETSGLNEFTQLIGLAAPTPPATQTVIVVAALPAEAAADGQGQSAIKGAKSARAGRMDDAETGDAVPRDSHPEATSTAERRPAEAPARAAEAPRARGIELAADKAAAARSASNDTLRAAPTATPGDASPRPTAPDALTPSFAAVLAQALPTATAAAAAAPATATGQVHAALHSSAFAPELGARVSLLAVDGVQQAELQLNPADMGPVTVQIVVDSGQAQVSFHAAQAETRQALEQSLPDLAAALQGQGLTLSGGGVFQQASQDTRGGDAEAGGTGSRGSRGRASGERPVNAGAVAAPARRTVGLLDTFA